MQTDGKNIEAYHSGGFWLVTGSMFGEHSNTRVNMDLISTFKYLTLLKQEQKNVSQKRCYPFLSFYCMCTGLKIASCVSSYMWTLWSADEQLHSCTCLLQVCALWRFPVCHHIIIKTLTTHLE